ncbi:MAG: hypothetical protein ACRDQZ_24480, partial [Mycobacteriales bacterium]
PMEMGSHRRALNTFLEDVQRINEQLLLLVVDPSSGGRVRRALQVSKPVAKLISAARAPAIGTALRCGVPLVVFTRTFHEIAALAPRRWSSVAAPAPPDELRALTRFTMHFVHELALRSAALTHALFKLPPAVCGAFGEVPLVHVETLVQRGCVLRLRSGDDPLAWDRLFVGGRCGDGRAQTLAHLSALQTLFMR